ncbi:MAG: glycosyltransferase family 2 protein [Clostridia bacterium]|nr:glycosyltransferase family 2 protein [Clostridia bacterium]MDY5555541.1 glycosyltransferase family 2 protein [Blautia sp.]
MNQPLVSVVMPVYNGGKYIKQAVESVYSQEVPLELLVIDDGSEDQTQEVLSAYMGREDFQYIRNKKNIGAAASRNRGVQAAKGEYIAFLDADDWWEKGKLKEQLEVLKETGYVLCSTGRELMNPDGTDTGRYISVGDKITYKDLLKHNSINCSSVLIRKEAALSFPMEHDDSHEDYITWLKVLRDYGPGAGIDKPYLKYRLSEEGKSRNKIKSAGMTYKVYRYMGYGSVKSLIFFISYAIHGIWKYYH